MKVNDTGSLIRKGHEIEDLEAWFCRVPVQRPRNMHRIIREYVHLARPIALHYIDVTPLGPF